jgi:Holliday junction resolvase
MVKKRPSRYVKKSEGTPRAQEDRIADRLGGKRVRGSGASIYSKADVRDVTVGEEGFLTECKTTKHGSMSVKWDWLTKITKEAMAVQKEPALAIEIRGGKECHVTDRDWIAIPVRVFEELIKKNG